MIKRVVEVSTKAYLHIQNKQLVVKGTDEVIGKVPIEDLGVLILNNPAITMSHQLISSCLSNNTVVVITDDKHMPTGLMLPLEGHSTQAKTICAQSKMKLPRKKQIWQQIVAAKIQEQSKVLKLAGKKTEKLKDRHRLVKSGDPENQEAQAARIYWKLLFGESFKRDQDGVGINVLLNYGYAIIRASVARAIVGTGLNPTLGIHHKSQYNAFALADDALEPIRPRVDLTVHQIALNDPEKDTLNQENKRALLEILTQDCLLKDKRQPLLNGLSLYAASLRRSMIEDRIELEFPLL